MTAVQSHFRHKNKDRHWPIFQSVPEERVDIEHIARHNTNCLGCGHQNNIGRRFCEVCGRIIVA